MFCSPLLTKFVKVGQVVKRSSAKLVQQQLAAATVPQCQQKRLKSDLYEPDYLILLKRGLKRGKLKHHMQIHDSIIKNESVKKTIERTRRRLSADHLCAFRSKTKDAKETGCYEQVFQMFTSMEPDEPVYDCLNLQLKGYDFALLESAQSQIHRYAEIMGIQVEECWATPAQQLKVQRFKPGGTAIDAEYSLNVYERNVQVVDVPAWALGSLLRVSRAILPEGCTLNVHDHTPDHEEIRYVPDNQLLDLKQQLEDMGGSRAEKKKRK